MIRRLLALLCLLPSLALAQQAAIPREPSLSLIIEPRHVNERGARVQEQILLRVVLVSPHPFSALTLDLPPVEDARTIVLREPWTREIQFYNQKGHVYETHLALFPEASGTLTIPSIGVAGSVTAPDGTEIAFDERRESVDIPVRPIDPRLQTDWWLVSGGVTLEESWTPDPAEFRVGDVVQRHVTLTVRGATPEQIPDLEQGRNAGYAVTGVRTDKRTDLTGEGVVTTVRQSWDLLVQSDDVFYVSPIQMDYWDPVADAPASALLSAVRVEALPYDEETIRQSLIDEALAAHRRQRIGFWLLLALPVAALVALAALLVRAWLPTPADRALLRRCRPDATPEAALIAVREWLSATAGRTGHSPVGQIEAAFGAQAARPVADLQRHLFARDTPDPPPASIAAGLVRSARRSRLAAAWRALAGARIALLRPKSLWDRPGAQLSSTRPRRSARRAA